MLKIGGLLLFMLSVCNQAFCIDLRPGDRITISNKVSSPSDGFSKNIVLNICSKQSGACKMFKLGKAVTDEQAREFTRNQELIQSALNSGTTVPIGEARADDIKAAAQTLKSKLPNAAQEYIEALEFHLTQAERNLDSCVNQIPEKSSTSSEKTGTR